MENDPHGAVEEYLDWLSNVKQRKSGTTYVYEGYLRTWLEWCEQEGVKAAWADATDIEKFMGRIRFGRAKGAVGTPRTIQKEHAILSGWYSYMARRHHWQNPVADAGVPATPPSRPSTAIALPTWRRMWNCTRLPDDARIVLGLGAFCGLRRFEIAALGPENFKQGWLVNFARKHAKVGQLEYKDLIEWIAQDAHEWCEDPQAQFFEPLARTLRRRKGEQSILDWGDTRPPAVQAARKHSLPPGGIDPQRIYKRLARWQRLAGLEPGVYTPHDLRRTAITLWVNPPIALEIVKACELADHGSPAETMKYTRQARLSEWRANHARRDRFG